MTTSNITHLTTTMKSIFSLAAIALFSATAFAQHVTIGIPTNGASLTAGANTNVQIDRQSFNSQATEVAVVIALQSCPTFPCISTNFGTILYNGPFTPVSPPGDNISAPNQNFTVNIPSNTPLGRAQLNVFHVSLVGASEEPFTETLNVTVNVV